MALVPIWLWGPEPGVQPPMSPSPWAAQPQLHTVPLQLQGSAWPSHAPHLAQVGTPSRSSRVTPLTPIWAGSHCSSLQALETLRCCCIHPQLWSQLHTCPAAQNALDTPMSMLWHWQAPGASHHCPRALCHRLASASLSCTQISGAACCLWGHWNFCLQEVRDQASELRLDA